MWGIYGGTENVLNIYGVCQFTTFGAFGDRDYALLFVMNNTKYKKVLTCWSSRSCSNKLQ